MLKQRLLTALVLALVLTALIFLLPTAVFSAFIALAIFIGAMEWTNLAALHSPLQKAVFLLLIAAGFAGLWEIYALAPEYNIHVFGAGLLWWILASLWVMFFSERLVLRQLPVPLRMLFGLLLLLPCWYALMVLHSSPAYGPAFVFFFLWITSWADSGAFFVGRKYGKTKLAPVISPGKSWEGVAGGFFAVGIISAVGSWLLGLSLSEALWLTLICFITVPFCIFGDLVESLCKRQAKIKDSGQLLPGHGGMLDRIDSLTAAGPVFMFLLLGIGL